LGRRSYLSSGKMPLFDLRSGYAKHGTCVAVLPSHNNPSWDLPSGQYSQRNQHHTNHQRHGAVPEVIPILVRTAFANSNKICHGISALIARHLLCDNGGRPCGSSPRASIPSSQVLKKTAAAAMTIRRRGVHPPVTAVPRAYLVDVALDCSSRRILAPLRVAHGPLASQYPRFQAMESVSCK
jgi:hypothetical protein